MQFSRSLHFKIFLSHVLAVLLVSGSIGAFLYSRAADSLLHGLQDRLQSSAALISWTIDANDLRHIRTAKDINDENYLKVLDHLRALRRMNPDVSYLYIMRLEGSRVVFVVDSDESDGQALPGQEYSPNVLKLIQGFTSVAVDNEVVPDEWGDFLSGYAPIKNSGGEFLVGVDMRADAVQDKYSSLRIAGSISLAATVVLAFLLARLIASRFMVPIKLAVNGCKEIASGKLETRIHEQSNDELDQLLEAFNNMADVLSSAEREKNEAFNKLTQSRDELGIRVQQRTADLKEMNDRLSNEIAMRMVAQQALHEAATTDPLTRLANRRAMLERLEHEVSRCKRSQTSFTVLMMDIDRFKNINDTLGHAAGDSILEEAAMRLKSMLRSQDSAGRWGGEEFLIILPDTTIEHGTHVAEKLRSRMADAPFFSNGEVLQVAASFGVAAYSGQGDAMTVIASADRAMYEAKKNGRNRVEVV